MFIDLYGEGDEYLNQDKIAGFYNDYITFNKYIELRIIDYEKEYKGRPMLHSRYASSLESLYNFVGQFSSKRFNIYIGSNTRDKPGRLDTDIQYRRTFYFDLEAIGDKPPITDKEYFKKLIDTVIFIKNKLTLEGIRINVLKISGRGLHIGIKIKPLLESEYKKKFITWYKDFKKKYNDYSTEKVEDRPPHNNIKFMDSMFNISRIESAPGTRHMKYDETPLRQILFLSKHENDIRPILDKVKVPEIKKIDVQSKYMKKYNNSTIFKSPEFQLLINYDDLPEGELHSKIILMIKILVRDNNIDLDIVMNKFEELGYDEVMDIPSEDYDYNPMIYNWWCLDNFEYCEDNKIKLNLDCYVHTGIKNCKFINLSEDYEMYIPPMEIDNFRDLVMYIKKFNLQTLNSSQQGIFRIYKDFLKKKIIENAKNPKLIKYIFETNSDFFNYIYGYKYPKIT